MDIVINIPDRIYYGAKNGITVNGSDASQILIDAVKNGKPLPKGHGKLVDLDQMCEDYWDGNYMEIHEDDLPNIKPIIEADRKEQ